MVYKNKILQRIWFFLICLSIIMACSSDDQNDIPEQKNIYRVQDITFYRAEEDQNDFILDCLDTLTYVNPNNSALPDTTFYPYQSLKDSLFVSLDTPGEEEITLKDSVPFRHMYIRPDDEIGYLENDTTYISKTNDTILFPVKHRSETIALSPSAKTRYDIIGSYWRIHYDISFELTAIRQDDQKEITLNGKLSYSIVSRGDRPEESKDKAPKTEIIKTEVN